VAGGSGSGGGVGKKESARRRSIGRKDDVEWADIGPSPSRPFVMWSGRAKLCTFGSVMVFTESRKPN
jgi:hypothetical protein